MMKWEICCKVKKNIEAFKQFCDKKIFQAGLRVFLKKMNLVNLSDSESPTEWDEERILRG